MEGSKLKTQLSTSEFEAEAASLQIEAKTRMFRIVDSSRISLAALSIALSIATMGLSAHALSVYERTHVAANFHLPLWPEKFDVQPTVALVACSTLIMAFASVSILASRVASVSQAPHISVDILSNDT